MASALRSAVSAALVIIGACGLECGVFPAAAQQQSVANSMGAGASAPASYYVEFRAADIGVYGHSYIAYGRLGANGRPASVQYADFHPEGGNLGLVAGHLLPVVGDVTPEKETPSLPLSTVFRRTLTAAEYKRVTAAIRDAHANTRVWNALAYNCNSFVANVAQAIGMKTPPTILFASAFIPALRDLNATPTEAAAAKRGVARRGMTTARDVPPKRTQHTVPRQPST